MIAKKYNIQIFAGRKICTDHSPGWERTKVIPGNLLISEVLLEGGNSYVFTARLEIQCISFPANFQRDIINNFAVF